MDTSPIAPVSAVDKALAAWAAAIEALNPAGATEAAEAAEAGRPERIGAALDAGLELGPVGGVDGVFDTADCALPRTPSLTLTNGSARSAVNGALADGPPGEPVTGQPAFDPAPPGRDTDSGHKAATLQSLLRPSTPPAEAPRHTDSALPTGKATPGEFALPAGLLVPALLTGLQIEPSANGPLPAHAPTSWPRPDRDERRRPPPRNDPDDGEPQACPTDDPLAPSPTLDHRAAAQGGPQLVFDAADAGDWCEALTRALTQALAARIVPQALLAAADQWKRGRCVVLACPQGADPAGTAWAFVLWPRPPIQAAAPTSGETPPASLALFGLRVEARLQWQALPPFLPWYHVRMVKEHHPRRGRQLLAPESDDGTPASCRLPCEVQLGPVPARSRCGCEVRVHIQAAQRFWAALGRQWSVHVVVGAEPLLPARAVPKEAKPC